MKTSKLIIGMCMLLLTTTTIVKAQKKWTQRITDQNLVYTPTDLPKGKTFTFYTYDPEQLNGESPKDFLLRRAKTLQSAFGDPTGKWKLTKEKDGSPSASINYKSAEGKNMLNGYVLCKLDDTRVFITQMVSSSDVGLLLKYALRYEEVTTSSKAYYYENNGTSDYSNNNTLSNDKNVVKNKSVAQPSSIGDDIDLARLEKMTGKERGNYIRQKIRVSPEKGLNYSQIEKIWLNSRYNVTTGKIDPNVYVLLKDGTVYLDLRIPPNELDIVASKKLEKKSSFSKRSDWSEWRRSGNGYQLKKVKSGKWEELKGKESYLASPGTRLDQKFISASGSQYYGSSKKYITFYPNGRFEMSSSFINDNSVLVGNSGPYVGVVSSSDKSGTRSTSVISGSSVAGGGRNVKNDGDKNIGNYEINKGYILLEHDNGYTHTELFLFDSVKKDKFILGNKVFWIPKE